MEALRDYGRDYYREHCTGLTQVYDGVPELLHGLCRGRDLRCAMILLLLVSAAALWALSGLFLLPLPLAMALAWVWQRLCDRGAAVSAAVPAAVLALCAVSSILFMF